MIEVRDRQFAKSHSIEHTNQSVSQLVGPNGVCVGIDHIEELVDWSRSNVRRDGKQSLVEGDGMGLAECRRVIEKAGGTISVASELGDGATFTVSLPAAPD